MDGSLLDLIGLLGVRSIEGTRFTGQERLFPAYTARPAEIDLSGGEWELPTDGTSSFLRKAPGTRAGRYPLAPVSAAIFGQRGRQSS